MRSGFSANRNLSVTVKPLPTLTFVPMRDVEAVSVLHSNVSV